MTRIQFVQAVEAFKTHREDISKTCRSRHELAGYLSAKIGAPISQASGIDDILTVAGCKLDDVIHKARRQSSFAERFGTNKRDIRVIIKTIDDLAKSLGYTPSDSFVEMANRRLGRNTNGHVSEVG